MILIWFLILLLIPLILVLPPSTTAVFGAPPPMTTVILSGEGITINKSTGLNIYRNERSGFAFDFPADWQIEASTGGFGKEGFRVAPEE